MFSKNPNWFLSKIISKWVKKKKFQA
jgi:hypothetical protein